ncbi:MAG: FAD/NAD(P)-binding protein [Fuerstiella sp.]
MTTIAIVGGGFSGTMAAVNLARLSDHDMRVVIINAKRPLGRGTAYGTTRVEHLLNVAARNMSALPDMPSHFVDWLRSRHDFRNTSEAELRQMFAPRRVYGDYIRGLLETCLHPIDARCRVKVESIDDEAVDVAVNHEGLTVLLKGGDTVDAEQVVLATGNQPPGAFPSTSPLRHDPRYRSDPWDDWLSRLPPPGGRVVLLGTGLTMVDIVLTLAEIGWDGKIVAVSRHGMLPKSHFRGIAYQDYLPAEIDSMGLAELRAIVQQHRDRLRQMSQNSAIAIDKLRPHTQRLWRNLSTADKREFLKRDAAIWNVTRHRIAVSIHNKVTDALDSGRLQIVSGTIENLIPGEQHIDVVLRDADGNELIQSGDLIINCTGPQSHFHKRDCRCSIICWQRDWFVVMNSTLVFRLTTILPSLTASARLHRVCMQSVRCLKARCGRPLPFPNFEARRCELPKSFCSVSPRRFRKQTPLSTTSESSRG